MSDSEIDEELFGDNGVPQNIGLGGELLQDDFSDDKSSCIQYQKPPEYIDTIEFRRFSKVNKIEVDGRYGYVCVFLYRPFYFPGQTVRGFALIDIFNDLPSREIMMRVKGREIPGKYGPKITRKMRNNPTQFHHYGFNQRQQSQYQSMGSSVSQRAFGGNNNGNSGSNYRAANEQGKDPTGTIEEDRLSANPSKIADMKKKALMENLSGLPPSPAVHKVIDQESNVKSLFAAQRKTQPGLMNDPPKFEQLEVIRVGTDSNPNLKTDQSQRIRTISANEEPNHDHKTNSSHAIELGNLDRSIKINQITQQEQESQRGPSHNRVSTMTVQENRAINTKKFSNLSIMPQMQTPTSNFHLHPQSILGKKGRPSPRQVSPSIVDELVSSALTLQKKQVSKKEDEAIAKKSIPLLDYKVMAFQFRDKEMPKGQYRLPFSFRLPQNIPGTFKFQRGKDIQKTEEESERITIEYTIEVYMDVVPKDQERFRMFHKIELDVREFLFTDQEISDDWQKYQQIVDLKKVLRPNTIFSQRSMDNLKFTEANDEESLRGNNESLSKIVKYNNHYGEDLKATNIEADMFQYGSLREKLNLLMTNQQQGIINPAWDFDQVIASTKCLCFKSSYIMHIVAQLNKQLFYPDEQVIVDFSVDNSRSQRDIKEIRCSLMHTISIKLADESLSTISYSLGHQDLKGVQKNKIQERQEFIFDLQHILNEFQQLHDYHKTARRMSVDVLKNHIFQSSQSALWSSASNKMGPHLKAQNTTTLSQRAFQKQRVKMLNDLDSITLLTVHGLSIKSDFSIELSIIVADMLGETKHSQSFPFTIRSRKNGDFINDLDSLGAQPIQTNVNSIMDKLAQFMDEPLSLPGCNFHAKLEY